MNTVHVLPRNDLIEHIDLGDDCPCGPRNEPVKRDDGSVGWVIVHRRQFTASEAAIAQLHVELLEELGRPVNPRLRLVAGHQPWCCASSEFGCICDKPPRVD